MKLKPVQIYPAAMLKEAGVRPARLRVVGRSVHASSVRGTCRSRTRLARSAYTRRGQRRPRLVPGVPLQWRLV